MNIALIGFGNMGREIEKAVSEQGEHKIISISYKEGGHVLDTKGLQNADVAIDFTSPGIVLQNIKEMLQLGVPLVVGTTGWYEEMTKVKKLVTKYKGSLIYGQNFSIGANIFFNVVAYASSLIGKYKEYDVFGVETHHSGKKDSPSGTARRLADVVLKNIPSKKVLQAEKLDRQILPDEFHFASVRGGRNFGRHEIVFDSRSDEIRLMHQAWGRTGFAQGALVAAEYIVGKKGLYNFSEIFEEVSMV